MKILLSEFEKRVCMKFGYMIFPDDSRARIHNRTKIYQYLTDLEYDYLQHFLIYKKYLVKDIEREVVLEAL